MLRIRREQLDRMFQADDRMLIGGIKRQVREDHPDLLEGIPNDLLDEMIVTGLTAARSFGLAAPADLAGFVYIMFEVGPEFYRHGAVRSVLTDKSIPPEKKLESLFDRTPPGAWDEIEANRADQTWFPELREQVD